MGDGLWEIRADLPTKRTARVMLCLHRGHLVAVHGSIKKTRKTPDEDLQIQPRIMRYFDFQRCFGPDEIAHPCQTCSAPREAYPVFDHRAGHLVREPSNKPRYSEG